MWDWILEYWLQALFGIILTAIVAIIKTEWSKIRAIGKGTQSLLRAELIRSGEKSGTGAKKWGKLKSGAGWIALDYTAKLKVI